MDHALHDQLRSARERELLLVVSVLDVDVLVSALVPELLMDGLLEPVVPEVVPLAPIVLEPVVPLAPIEEVSLLFAALPLVSLVPLVPALLPVLFVLLELVLGEVLEELEPDVWAIA